MKRTYIIAAIVVTALIVAGVILWERTRPTPTTVPNAVASETPPSTTPTPVTVTPTPVTPVVPTPAKLSYNDALKKYAGQRFQFVNCTTGPTPVSVSSLSLKKGDDFMLDNRDPKAHTIKFGAYSYKVGANNFTVARAPATRGEYNVTCDGGGAAKLSIQP